MPENRAYLDWNASAPLLPAARAAMLAVLDGCANPSSVHREGRAMRAAVEAARRNVAAMAGAAAENVVFTSGATEAASTLLTPDWLRGREPIKVSRLHVCAADHPCTLGGGRFAADRVMRLPVDGDGVLDLDVLRAALEADAKADGPPLVAVHAANNETGVVQPWEAVAAVVHEKGGLLVLDAVQAAAKLSLAGMLDHADHIILSAHKIGGPKGAGAFVSRAGAPMPRALVSGGGQERGFRAGTENVAAIAGFGAAAGEAAAQLAGMGRVAAMRARFEAVLRRHAADVVIHGGGALRLANTSFFSIPGIKAETAQMAFDLAGVALSAGSACSSGKVGPSHVLAAMGRGNGAAALRVSIGPETAERDLALFEEALREVVRRRVATRAAEEAA